MPRRRLSFFGFFGLVPVPEFRAKIYPFACAFFFFPSFFLSFSFLFYFLEMAGLVPSLEEWVHQSV